MIIRNHEELQQAYQSEDFARLYITPDAEHIIKDSLKLNVELLVDAYGADGKGGYINIIPHSISTEEGRSEYLAELAKFNLQPNDCEFDNLLVESDTQQIRLQLFVMTEYNTIYLFCI